SELIKIIHSKSVHTKTTERSVNSIDSLHTVLQQCLDNIRNKVLLMKRQLAQETSVPTAVSYGEIIRNIRNQLNSIRTLSLPDSVVLCDGEKILFKVECRYHLYDNVTTQLASGTHGTSNSHGFGSLTSPRDNNTAPTVSTNEEEYVPGTCFITNYQIIFNGVHQNSLFKKSFSLHSIQKMDKSGKKKSVGNSFSYRLNFLCKDARTISLSFDKSSNSLKDVRKCVENTIATSLFCFLYKAEYTQNEVTNLGWNIYDPKDEFARMGIPSPDWKYTHINSTHFICETYPSLLVVPDTISDEQLKAVANFRSKGRIPALSYRHWSNKTSITRCSQPRVGIGRNRCEEDEQLVNAIRLTAVAATTSSAAPSSSTMVHATGSTMDGKKSGSEKTLYIIDARPYANAVGNRAKGAGWEIMTNYPNCEIEFMDIANIHV
ncbi:hypothetical protein SAMD00019534_036480, partial [Acytostelium subglobosum LB1]|uniref:hypothetical protein n=1 Tax=Acytostelium subglobosum LB1 TaxID=1410327 RepID=UPI0006450CA2